MSTLARTDKSLFGRWWWTIDRWLLAAIIAIAAIGALLTLAASPAVAERLDLDTFHFVQRQFIFLPGSMIIMVLVSLMTPRGVRRLAVGCAVFAIFGMLATLLLTEAKVKRKIKERVKTKDTLKLGNLERTPLLPRLPNWTQQSKRHWKML